MKPIKCIPNSPADITAIDEWLAMNPDMRPGQTRMVRLSAGKGLAAGTIEHISMSPVHGNESRRVYADVRYKNGGGRSVVKRITVGGTATKPVTPSAGLIPASLTPAQVDMLDMVRSFPPGMIVCPDEMPTTWASVQALLVAGLVDIEMIGEREAHVTPKQ
jgi:hypothetical protein